ncbi:type II toxin-antitoxin system VapC family toxin [Deinococcus detaillensis]|uniref:Ribonuclease VapC n=1 Tax=Deinococcus detaillensis TaxID=2592048 RepID=A0A553V2S4_9DEIO|nr:PIN domain-containing protein [Deinococcus detaillensis]TSA86722.1 type II toxin-antitoxin system VapC family toxin [Deinococcus detaillensis]
MSSSQPLEGVLLDANIVLRYLTNEPPEMAGRSRALLERAERGELRLILTPLVLAECVWVLKSFYKLPLVRISGALQQVLELGSVTTQQRPVISAALISMAQHNVDFADAYLAELARAEGLSVASFDQDFSKLSVTLVSI